MKEAEKIIDRSKEWFNDDQKNRAAVISAVAEERKKIDAIISARKEPKGGKYLED